jgi:transposase InsO family protein
MAHRTARLTVFSRQVLVTRVTVEGWPAAEVARQFQVSRSTAYKWVRRFRIEGEAGLTDRSSRPHRSPRALPDEAIAVILDARRYRRYGPHRLAAITGHPRSTIYGVLCRHRVNRLDGLDRLTGRPVRCRYVAPYPGALIHQDAKPLTRVPIRYRERAAPWSGSRPEQPGHDQLEVFVDDHSRLACVVVTRNAGQGEAVRAVEVAVRWFASQGITVERILTDNGASYCSRRYEARLAELGIRHSRTRVRRPQTNGKAERFIGTLIHEWAYARPYRTNQERLHRLAHFLDFYNRRRPHTALGGRSPLDVLSTT